MTDARVIVDDRHRLIARRRRHGSPRLLATALLAAAVVVVPASAALVAGGVPSYPAGSSPRSVAVADFDGDADDDVAVANSFGDDISILLGDGDGSFAAPHNYPTGDNPVSVVAGDLDGDGDGDLAVSNFLDNSISILLGDGDGTFAAAVDYPVGIGPAFLAVGDLDADGDSDLAVPNFGEDAPAPNTPGTTVSILLGDGDGTFAAATEYSVGTAPATIAIGNFDSDAHRDLAVANLESASVSIVLGNGDGSFGPALDQPVGFALSVVTGHFDGDTFADLAVAGNETTILLGNGDGSFDVADTYAGGVGQVAVATDDVNSDTDLDLAVVDVLGDSVSIRLGNGDGTFGDAVDYPAGPGPFALAFGHFDDNASADIVVANFDGDTVSILLGNGDGTFAVDADPPIVTIGLDPASPNGANGWYVTGVGVAVSSDDGAGTGVAETRCALDPSTPPASFGDLPAAECSVTNVVSDGLHTLYASAIDTAGNSAPVISSSFKIDRTDPTVSCDVGPPGPVFLLQGAGGSVSASVTDATSGTATGASAPASVGSVGNKTVALTGSDNGGNSADATCPYRVSYRFDGFQSPVPRSSFKRGSTIPVKFSLSDASGQRIPDATANELLTPCRVRITLDGVPQAGCATYDQRNDVFQYDLKTPKSLAEGSHQLAIDVSAHDGSGVVNTDGTEITIRA